MIRTKAHIPISLAPRILDPEFIRHVPRPSYDSRDFLYCLLISTIQINLCFHNIFLENISLSVLNLAFQRTITLCAYPTRQQI